MRISERSERYQHLEELGATLFGTQDAVTTLSGATALLTLACCLGRPGTRALLPGWMCSSVFHALLLAGLHPVPVDIDQQFTMSFSSAQERCTGATSLLLYAPFGGHAPDVAAWVAWARQRNIAVIADLVHSPDPALWRSVAGEIPALITSFRPGKPLGAAGGGLIAGSQAVVETARTFLNAGRDRSGLKVSLGLELPLPGPAVDAALHQLERQPALMADWRRLTGRILRSEQASCLPGWVDSPYALAKIPLRQSEGRRLNPDRTYTCAGWREALLARFGVNEHVALATLDELHHAVTIRRVDPREEENENDAAQRTRGTGSAGPAGAQRPLGDRHTARTGRDRCE